MNSILANMGTPLMWWSGCHLLLANAVIGAFEARAIKNRRPEPGGAGLLIIIGNYFSAWCGAMSLWQLWRLLETYVFTGPPLYVAPYILIVVAAVAYLMTLVLEYPFFVLATAPGPGRWRSAMRYNLIAQSWSYLVLALLYALVSPLSVYWNGSIDRSLSFVPRSLDAWVYYIDHASGDVCRVRPDGSGRETVQEAEFDQESGLYAQPGPEPEPWTLWVYDNGARRRLTRLEQRPGVYRRGPEDTDEPYDGFMPMWTADLRPADQRNWTVRPDWFAEAGLRIMAGPHRFNLAFATPWSGWRAQSATILPGNLVVFQFGPGQICVFDVGTRKLGVVARGRGPVVTIGDAVGDPTQAP